jgi:hypothetical protein
MIKKNEQKGAKKSNRKGGKTNDRDSLVIINEQLMFETCVQQPCESKAYQPNA